MAEARMSTEFLPIINMASVVLWLCVLMPAAPILVMSWAHESPEHPCQESEKAALLAFYDFSGFDGLDAMWPSANRTMYCACEWSGVECDEQGFIVSLYLQSPEYSSFNLSKSVGTVPWPRLLAPLRFLKELRMFGFFHESPLPREVGLLSQSLTTLEVLECKLLPPLPIESLSNLSKLTQLSLATQDWWNYGVPTLYNAPIPQQICNISSLQYLDLRWNSYTANIPPCIGSLPSLSYLDLSSNTLQGSIPEQIWTASASNLTYLALSDNFLSGQIHLTGSIANQMRFLYLDQNNLNGSIPRSVGELRELTSLFLSYNNFTGSIPAILGDLRKLTFLDLSSNNFTGSIPASLGDLRKLAYLDLSFNNFTGSIPASLGNLTKLERLYLAGNLLFGEIPHQLGNIDYAMSRLDLSENQLSGKIPNSLSKIGGNGTEIIMVDLHSNNLTGALPWTLLTGSLMFRLDVHSNYITGITAYDSRSSANTSSLEELDLSSNYLKDAIPSVIGHLSALLYLDLSHNLLDSASFHDSRFPNFTGLLNSIDLSFNELEGTIPAWFWSLPAAQYIDLSMNKLRGDVKLDAVCALLGSSGGHFYGSNNNFTRIQIGSQAYNSSCTGIVLDLHSNQLSGLVPWHAASNLTNNVFWSWLSLADNNFFGTLPEFPHNNMGSAAAVLDLSRNRLSGTIPTSARHLGLHWLSLSFNNFSGEIPSSLCANPKRLDGFRRLAHVLKLDSNSLSGSIPHDLGLCNDGLQSLVLRDNMLTGLLPNWELSNLSKSLVVLDLSLNRLQGEIPGWVLQMQSLRVLILSHNAFCGALPAIRWNTTQLQVLDLSSNELSGGIPGPRLSLLQGFRYNSSLQTQSDTQYNESITIQAKGGRLEFTYILRATVSLDLSDNALTGAIPAELGFLDGLVFLNLSYNRLSGTIPDGFGKLYQLNSLDLSSNELEGEIPSEGLCSLTFLSVVNLSHNQLSGPIPQCQQWSTFSRESFLGNSGLCGPKSEQQQSCNPNLQNSSAVSARSDDDEDNHEFWLGILIGLCATFPFVFWLSVLWRPIRYRISKASTWVLHKLGANNH